MKNMGNKNRIIILSKRKIIKVKKRDKMRSKEQLQDKKR